MESDPQTANQVNQNGENVVPQAVPCIPVSRKFPEAEVSPAVKKWSVKISLVVIALVILQLPLYLVRDLSQERSDKQRTAVNEIATSWGNPVTIQEITCSSCLPQTLTVSADLKPQIRYRGIYQSVVYTADCRINARFDGFDAVSGNIELGLDGFNGLQDAAVTVNGQKAEFTVSSSRIKITLPAGTAAPLLCDIQLKLRGSSQFKVLCCGSRNTVDISGNWSDPNFGISTVLPDSREVKEDGFSAQWQINNLVAGKGDACAAVDMHIAASTYLQVERTMTYATFFLIVFFFTLIAGELITRVEIHPLQYLVAAGAPVLFYLMLLAVGEKAGFGIGFAISAAVIVGMVTGYARMFLRKTLPALLMGVVFAASYAINYLILQMEEFALLSGTIVLAVILGVLMLLTGRLNARNDL